MPSDNATVSQNLDADFNNSSGSKRDVLRILYVFSGKSRKGSVSHWCKKLAKRFSITVEVAMIDIKVRPHLDLTKESVRKRILLKLQTGNYHAIILSPPCSTFSRAPWSNRKGPRPVRSYVHHRGLQRLTWSERKKADWGNTLDFTLKLIQTAINKDVRFILFENPEDLGALQQGPYEGQRPASMWQDEKFEALIQTGQIDTVAF